MSPQKKLILALAAALLAATLVAGSALALTTSTTFKMVRSSGAVTAGCLKGANGTVSIHSLGPVEVMNVSLNRLPPNREFDLFVTQLPNTPFGVSWYQGDLRTNARGHAMGRFIGRFSVETFAVAPGSGPAPGPHKARAVP
ncbi:hypothetical protein [Rubrobacter calidifluminis]|uniref:hypothetical protein n=1 Tax=Rubrobacter calidifluminis TaxID=1392640 RepID=UPI00236263A0|nr:hypothetical protein [Rubrobacter calidifluminis]